MRKLAFLLALALAPALHAQAPEPGPGPNPGRGRGIGGPPPARRGPQFGPRPGPAAGPSRDIGSFLLAHTAELKLSDQQVTRLAALARRASERRETMRRAMDSLATGAARRDSAGRGPGGPPAAMRAQAERLRDQRRAELREALGVLTLDQQATAWELGRGRGI